MDSNVLQFSCRRVYTWFRITLTVIILQIIFQPVSCQYGITSEDGSGITSEDGSGITSEDGSGMTDDQDQSSGQDVFTVTASISDEPDGKAVKDVILKLKELLPTVQILIQCWLEELHGMTSDCVS